MDTLDPKVVNGLRSFCAEELVELQEETEKNISLMLSNTSLPEYVRQGDGLKEATLKLHDKINRYLRMPIHVNGVPKGEKNKATNYTSSFMEEAVAEKLPLYEELENLLKKSPDKPSKPHKLDGMLKELGITQNPDSDWTIGKASGKDSS